MHCPLKASCQCNRHYVPQYTVPSSKAHLVRTEVRQISNKPQISLSQNWTIVVRGLDKAQFLRLTSQCSRGSAAVVPHFLLWAIKLDLRTAVICSNNRLQDNNWCLIHSAFLFKTVHNLAGYALWILCWRVTLETVCSRPIVHPTSQD